jgi:hypothetical protein
MSSAGKAMAAPSSTASSSRIRLASCAARLIRGFDLAKAEAELSITVEPFHHTDGNCQGYAITDQRRIAVNPVAYDPLKTSLHECAHVLLHPNTTSSDSTMLAR